MDSTFAKRNQNLLILTLFIELVGFRCTSDDEQGEQVLFDFKNCIDQNRLITLIECLWDTYPSNKDTALNLLVKIDKKTYDEYNFSSQSYYNIAIGLLSSRKPIDSMTSVYLMMFLQSKSSLKDLFDCNMNYETKSLSIYLIRSIEYEFAQHCALAKSNLLLAALQKPIYGPLAAIRNLIILSVNE